MLIENGADVNKSDNDKASPLYYSLGYCSSYDIEIVKYLVQAGADVNKPTYDGDTPMHMVGYRANIESMMLLIKKGAKIDVINDQGKTPLHVLIEKTGIDQTSKIAAVKMFLAYGAAANLVNKEGESAITLAKKHLPEAVTWLEHPETLPTIQELEANYNAANMNSEVKNNDSTVNQVSNISYNNKLLNHFELLVEASTKGNLKISRVIDESAKLDDATIEQIIAINDADLLLAGLISVDHL